MGRKQKPNITGTQMHKHQVRIDHIDHTCGVSRRWSGLCRRSVGWARAVPEYQCSGTGELQPRTSAPRLSSNPWVIIMDTNKI